MPIWAGWAGWVATFAFGALSLYQWVVHLLEKRTHDLHTANLIAVRSALVAMRAMCTEAIELGEVINTDPARHFVRQIAYSALTMEYMVNAVLGPKYARQSDASAAPREAGPQ